MELSDVCRKMAGKARLSTVVARDRKAQEVRGGLQECFLVNTICVLGFNKQSWRLSEQPRV